MKTTINLQDELIAENRKALAADQAVLAQQAALDAETDKLVNAALDRATADYETAKQKTLETLGLHYKLAEAKQVREKQSKWAHLPQERIFTKDAIRELCLKYNLRFLPTSYYKGALDSQLPDKLDELRKANGGLLPGERMSPVKADGPQGSIGPVFSNGLGALGPTGAQMRATGPNAQELGGTLLGTLSLEQYNQILQQQVWANMQNTNAILGGARSGMSSRRWDHAIGSFCIAAPAESFALQPRPIDPLLFCNLGDDQYYLVHKWGSDISWSRRWLKHWRLVAYIALRAATNVGIVGGAYFGLKLLGASRFDATFWTSVAFIAVAALNFIWGWNRPLLDQTTTKSNWDSPYTS